MIKIKLLGFNQQVTKPTLNVKSIKQSGVKYEAERFNRPSFYTLTFNIY